MLDAVGSGAHGDCFRRCLRETLEHGHGRAALHYRNGKSVGARWRLERRAPRRRGRRGAWTRRNFYCDDADFWGIDDWLFDAVEVGKLEVTTGVRARTEGDEVEARSSAREIATLWQKWRGEAERWSAKPGAGAALAAHVKDFRLTWVGIYVSRGPSADLPGGRGRAGRD
ncbi:MAG TPA: hypothetical protein VM537_28150 [Anaerolineae bacterium]|nr:hypothetical protein [Anaerolineae bacterium]